MDIKTFWDFGENVTGLILTNLIKILIFLTVTHLNLILRIICLAIWGK